MTGCSFSIDPHPGLGNIAALMARLLCRRCGRSFEGDSPDEVRAALRRHERVHARATEQSDVPRVLERTPMSSARIDLAVQLVVDLASVDELARAGYSVRHDSVFVPLDPPRHIGTQVGLRLTVAGRVFELRGVVVTAVPDPADPRVTTEPRGNGVFLTSASPGWSELCDGVVGEGAAGDAGAGASAKRSIPLLALEDWNPHEFDDEPSSAS
jgi:hypothetical protein